LASNPGTDAFDWGLFPVSLFLLRVGILGCVEMDVAPLCQTALGGIGSGWLSSVFPWCDGPSDVGRIFVVSHQEAGL
jgi:hypothetical protein